MGRNPAKEKGEKYKDFLTVGELAAELGRTPRSIQKWEEKGYIDPPKVRAKSGWRLYSPEEVAEIKRRAKKIKPGRYINDRHPSTWWNKPKPKKKPAKKRK